MHPVRERDLRADGNPANHAFHGRNDHYDDDDDDDDDHNNDNSV
jgi:hypothetical protein